MKTKLKAGTHCWDRSGIVTDRSIARGAVAVVNCFVLPFVSVRNRGGAGVAQNVTHEMIEHCENTVESCNSLLESQWAHE